MNLGFETRRLCYEKNTQMSSVEKCKYFQEIQQIAHRPGSSEVCNQVCQSEMTGSIKSRAIFSDNVLNRFFFCGHCVSTI